MKCKICRKEYKTKTGLEKHEEKNNCNYKCFNCYKQFSTKQSLTYHTNNVSCKKKYKCELCQKLFTNNRNMQIHIQNHENEQNENTDIKQLEDMLNNLPKDRQININNLIINNKINNNKVNNVKNVNNVINNNKISFFDTQPRLFQFDYVGNDDLKKLSMYNEQISEEMVDKYMYEEETFKESHSKEAFLFFEKKTLEFEGFKILFNELQKNPKNRNTRIKKSKSGKCYIYGCKGWEEIKLQKAITKICYKLCNFLYDQDTSINQFICLVSSSQPKRMSALRKHIEQYILNLNKETLLEQVEIEQIET